MRLTVTKTLPLLAVLAGLAPGQTQVDLRTQSKSVDFSASPSTKPFTAGPALPTGCTVGQMYFVTSAIQGQNMYGCSAANTWTLQSGGPTSPTTVENAGAIVGTRPILSLTAGQGMLWSISDTGQAISAQSMLDATLALTRAGDQSGANLLCQSSSAARPGITYSCAMTPTLGAYTTGMLLRWIPDMTAVGSLTTTLNIDVLGATPVEKADGVTNPASADIVGGQLYELWYDGQVFRLVGGAGSGTGGSAQSINLIANGTASLGTSAIPSGSCAATVNSVATGVVTSDNIEADFAADPTSTTGYSPAMSGMLTILKYPGLNAVNFKVCNNTASTVTPGAVTLNWRVIR